MKKQIARSVALVLVLTACTPSEEPSGVASTAPGTQQTAVAEAPAADPAPTSEPEVEEPEVDEPPAADGDNPLGLAEGEYPDFRQVAELGAAGTCMYAGPEWCEDANGNVWPDFVEEGIGRDPAVDGCLQGDCGGPELQDFGLGALQENTVFVLDASGSMAGDAGGGQSKMDAAKSALVEYVTYTPDYADLGLIVYGHRGDNSDAGRPESCAGIETFAGLGELTFENVEAVVGGFQPTGWTPIAAALDAAGPVVQAAAAADAAEGLEGVVNRIILISDGVETCDGDPVGAAQRLVDLGVDVVVDVVGFDIAESDRAALEQVAAVTGGVYRSAADGAALRAVLGEYDAQRVAVAEAISCQVEAIGQGGQCSARLGQEAQDWIGEQEIDTAREEGDTARVSFLVEWLNAAIIESSRDNEARREDRLVRLEELRDLYQEAVERREAFQAGRNQKPIGRTVSLDCPFVDSRPAAT